MGQSTDETSLYLVSNFPNALGYGQEDCILFYRIIVLFCKRAIVFCYYVKELLCYCQRELRNVLAIQEEVCQKPDLDARSFVWASTGVSQMQTGNAS